MAQEETVTIMEKLFKALDEKAKSLNEENGQSFIENLGLAMEDIYRNNQLNDALMYDQITLHVLKHLNDLLHLRYLRCAFLHFSLKNVVLKIQESNQ